MVLWNKKDVHWWRKKDAHRYFVECKRGYDGRANMMRVKL